MKNEFLEIIEDTPIIASVKNFEGLEKCLNSDIQVVFVLFGDICNITEIVDRIKDAGKIAMVHLDLIGGLSAKEVAVDFIHQQTRADGILTTKQTLIHYAKKLGMYTVLRFFVMDSMALSSIEKQANQVHPDLIEILPGIMPKVIKKIRSISRVPVIAGGLIADKEDVMAALDAGAISISATKEEIWFL